MKAPRYEAAAQRNIEEQASWLSYALMCSRWPDSMPALLNAVLLPFWLAFILCAVAVWVGVAEALAGVVAACALVLPVKRCGDAMRRAQKAKSEAADARLKRSRELDVDDCDFQLPKALDKALLLTLQCASGVLLAIFASPWFALAVPPIFYCFYATNQAFRQVSRETQRLKTTALAPCLSALEQSLGGLGTIRAFAAADRLDDAFLDALGALTSWCWLKLLLDQWLLIRLTSLSSHRLCLRARRRFGRRRPVLAGLALSQTVLLTQDSRFAVRFATLAEAKLNAVDRLLDYGDDLPQERGAAGARRRPARCAAAGPRPRSIDAGLAIFRLAEAEGGRVLLGGVDVANVGLDALRARLAAVPQDPQLEGTLRSNVDPFGRFDDDAVAAALRKARCAFFDGDLDARVSEGGANLSCGERQLLCFARVLLRSACVVLLDEATSSIDADADAQVQAVIRAEIRGRSTMVVIAHRIKTATRTSSSSSATAASPSRRRVEERQAPDREGRRGEERGDAKHDSPARKRSISGSGDDAA
ncbi:ATPase [Aureococcus anophagefferens]|nr:ATPase [Aureococcus anophagefferens]